MGAPPEHMAYAWWDWDYQNPLRNRQSALNEITVEIEIHNDIELAGAGNGIYLMGLQWRCRWHRILFRVADRCA